MAARLMRGRRVCLAVSTCLVGLAALVAAASLGVRAPAGQGAPDVPTPVRLLQMNLCDSGLAGCYTGRSAAEAAAVIRAVTPDLITVNEVCRDDLTTLQQALANGAGAAIDTGAASGVVSAFQPALDRRTGAAFRCRNGQPYGIGLIVRRPGSPASRSASGVYPTQDSGDPEERVWLCMDDTRFVACTTHLANTSLRVARAQCSYLLDTAIPAVRARNAATPVVLGGDLNLRVGSAELRTCLPAIDRRADDGGVQEVVATPEFTVVSHRSIGMQATTDHPGLLVALTLAAHA
jgi:endonuclease/exonuclease/phosphatase family metal-dependent hydrolase